MGRPAKLHLGDLAEALCGRRRATASAFSVAEWMALKGERPGETCADCDKVLASAARKLRPILGDPTLKDAR